MTDPRRAETVRRAAEGDADALQHLIVQYHAPLRRAVEARLSGPLRRVLDPDDVLQEAYAAAFASVPGRSFDGPAAFYRWLEAIAIQQLKEASRNLHRKKRDIARTAGAADRPPAASSYPDLLARLASPDSTPSRKLARRESAAALLASLARLTPDQRAVVRLRFLEDRPVAEIAARLDKSEPAVHMLCHRGLASLRAFLAAGMSRASG